MDIKKSVENGKTIYRITGRIDTQTAPELQAELDKGFEEGNNNIVLDFEKVDYLSSAGLRTVLHAQKKINTIEGASMIVNNVNSSIMEVFDMTGFTDFLTINPDVQRF